MSPDPGCPMLRPCGPQEPLVLVAFMAVLTAGPAAFSLRAANAPFGRGRSGSDQAQVGQQPALQRSWP